MTTGTVGFDDLRFGARAVYIPAIDTAAVSDLHVGLERAARASGVSMPLDEERSLEETLRDALSRFDPSTVVFNGDVHHSFGELGDSGRTIRRLGSVVESSGADPVFVKGNHDTMLDEAVETETWYEDDGVVFVHGDTVPPNLPDGSLYVVGHDHPAVEIELQKQPCFLYGPYEAASVLMTPAFNPLCEGVVVNEMGSNDLMSPFVRESLGDFRVVVETDDADEALRFPPLREFRRML